MEENQGSCDFLQKTKVKVSLAYTSIKPVIHMIISNKCRDSFGGFEN